MNTSDPRSTTLSKLEAKEILRYLQPGVDDDVRAKLEAIANTKGTIVLNRAESAVVREIAAHHELIWENLSDTEQLIYGGRNEDGSINTQAGRTAIATINTERRLTSSAQERMQQRVPNLNPKDAANADFAPPDAPERWGIEKVSVGQKNSAGDTCIDIKDGISICVCPRKHAYFMNNPAVPGCTTCAATGQLSEAAPDDDPDPDDRRADANSIEGQDSRW